MMVAILILLALGVSALVIFGSGRNRGDVEQDHVQPRRTRV